MSSTNDHRICTRCSSPCLRRSRTRIWERPLRLLFLRPYRCRDCGHRQFDFILGQRATIHGQSDSLSAAQFPPGVAHATAGSIRFGIGRKWILIYGLLACMAVLAIASLRLGNRFLNRDYLRAFEFSLATLVHKVHDQLPRPEAAAVASPQVEAPRPMADEADKSAQVSANDAAADETAKGPASVQLTGPRSSPSREEDTSVSSSAQTSSAEAIRAPRPKLPASIKAKITSDNTVQVRVRIDKSGRVVGATALSANGPAATSLVRYALATARRWRFLPARHDGKPVRSENILEFLFRPSDILVSRVEASSELLTH